ncbi:MAG: hypothetical protein VX278_24205 [Myxococcota bacterium]|nr:hypothetical protein [Myxococcota bacterium]
MSEPLHVNKPRRRTFIGLVVFSFVWLFASTQLGFQYAQTVGSHFSPPQTLNDRDWRSQTSDVKENAKKTGKGAHIVDGVLSINRYGSIGPWSRFTVADIEVQISPTSEPINFLFEQGRSTFSLNLDATKFRGQMQKKWVDCNCDGRYRIYVSQDKLWIQYGSERQKITNTAFYHFMLTTNTGDGEIEWITLRDRSGNTLIQEDFSAFPVSPSILNSGRWMGLGIGIISLLVLWRSRSIITFLVYGVPMYALPLWIASMRFSDWNHWVQKLYLTQTKEWEVATTAVFLSLIPAILLGISHLGLELRKIPIPPTTRRGAGICWLIGILLTLFLSNYYTGLHWTIGLQAVFLLIPGWLAWRENMATWSWLLRDAPSFFFVVQFGWDTGFMMALLWRITMILSSVRTLRENHARHTLDTLFVSILLVPIALELCIRDTYLNKAWHVDSLTFQYNSKDPTEYLVSMWNDACGTKGQRALRVVFTGGSSTGGDYQFRQTPHLFFAGQSHSLLCPQLGSKQRMQTQNFGRGGMDTHIISHSMDELFHMTKADLVVMYVGNNDLLTRKSPFTKKQLRDRMLQWQNQLTGIKHYTSRLRLVIGSSLLFRQVQSQEEMVSAVPLDDAQENFERIAEMAKKHNSKVLLLTEYINPKVLRNQKGGRSIAESFRSYSDIQRSLAESHESIYYYDIWNNIAPYAKEDLFIDNNHLNMQGNKRVAQLISPMIAEILGISDSEP